MATARRDPGERVDPGTAYAEPLPGARSLLKILVGAFALLGVGAVAWVGWVAYDEGVRVGEVKSAPIIQADAGEIKRKPEKPGGLNVPHQDKLVFNRLAPGDADEPVERLLPPPEAPIAIPVSESRPVEDKSVETVPAPAETEVATALTPKLIEPPKQDQPKPAVATPPPPPPAPPAAQEPAKVEAKAPPPEPKSELAAKTPAPPPAAPAPAEKPSKIVPTDAWGVQLVSLSSRKDADAVWSRLKKANNDLLGDLSLRVQTVKLTKGTFYRVQAVPLADRAAAASLCGTLKTRKQDCLVVAPAR